MKEPISPEVRDRWLAELQGHMAALDVMFASGCRLTVLVRNPANPESVFVVSSEPNPQEAFRAAGEYLSSGKAISLATVLPEALDA